MQYRTMRLIKIIYDKIWIFSISGINYSNQGEVILDYLKGFQ